MAELATLRQRSATLPELCQGELWPLYEKVEQAHQFDPAALKLKAIRALPLMAGGYGLVLIARALFPGTSLGSLALGVGGIVLVWGGHQLLRELVKALGQVFRRMQALRELGLQVKKRVVQHLDPTFTLHATPSFPKELYRACGLFPSAYDRSEAEDQVAGRVGATDFQITEIATYRRETSRNSKGSTQTRWIPIYRGLLFQAAFNKNFTAHTTVKTDRAERHLGDLARGLQRLSGAFSKGKLVELENPDFEAQFKVESTDPIEARYILTPTFMERLLSLRAKSGIGMEFSFLGAQVIVSIPRTQPFLELGYSFKDLTQSVNSLSRDLLGVLELIELLDLNNRIYQHPRPKAVGQR